MKKRFLIFGNTQNSDVIHVLPLIEIQIHNHSCVETVISTRRRTTIGFVGRSRLTTATTAPTPPSTRFTTLGILGAPTRTRGARKRRR